MDKTIVCLNGELIIRPDGAYTFAHFYEHPITKHSVVLVGMIHFGDEVFYQMVANLINSADVVLYEASIHQEKENDNGASEKVNDEQEELKKVYSDSIDEAFFPALCFFFKKAEQYLGLFHESNCFDAKRSNWVTGDGKFGELSKESWQQLVDTMTRGLARLSVEEKIAIVEFFRGGLAKIRDGVFQKHDILKGLALLETHPILQQIMDDATIGRRDDITFETFDKIVEEKKPSFIAIKFGVAHMPYQRQLLEQRGYIQKRSVELRAISI